MTFRLIQYAILWTGIWLLVSPTPIQFFKSNPFRMYNYETSYVNVSHTKWGCALLTNQHGAAIFEFIDGECIIHETGQLDDTTDNSEVALQVEDRPHFSTKLYIGLKFSTLKNGAFGKPCYPPTHHFIFVCSRAVDGVDDTQYYSKGADKWWIVDLESEQLIIYVDILPHTGVPLWFQNIKIYVGSTLVTTGDFSSYTEIGEYQKLWDGANSIKFHAPMNSRGRYVAMHSSAADPLDVYEVKVMVPE